MPTQQEIAEHLDIDQAAVSRHMERLDIDWRNSSMTEIRLRYLQNLRAQAAGHRSADGLDLTHERAMTERIDRQLKELTLAEKRQQLVNVAQLEADLQAMVVAFRSELLARDDKLKDDLDALYGIEVDRTIIEEYTRAALEHLARYDIGGEGADGSSVETGEAAGEIDDDGLGDCTSLPLGEGGGEAG